MTLEEAEEYLFFARDEMLKNNYVDAELIWKVPNLALEHRDMGQLVRRWFYTTKSDMRAYLETRIIEKVQELT